MNSSDHARKLSGDFGIAQVVRKSETTISLTQNPSDIESAAKTMELTRTQRRQKNNWGFLFLAAWTVLALYDTGLLNRVPSKALLRPVIVTLFAMSMLIWGRRVSFMSSSSGVGSWLFCGTLVALLSSFLCETPELGLLKVVLFCIVIPPLVFYDSGSAFLFGESLNRRWVIGCCSVFFLIGIYRGFFPVESDGMGNTNYVSSLSVATLPAALISVGKHKSLFSKWFRQLCPFIVLVTCVMNHSRGALAGAMALTVVWFALYKKPNLTRLMFGGVSGVLMLVVMIFLSETAADYLSKGDNNYIDPVREKEIDMFLENFQIRPWLGYGFGLSWRVRVEDLDMVLRHGRLSWAVGEFGSSVLAVLAGGGIFLMVTIVGFFAALFRYVYRAMKLEYRQRGASVRYSNIVLLTAGIVGLLTNSLSEGWFLSPMTLPAFSLYLYVGSVLYYSSLVFATQRRNRSWNVT